MAKSGLSSLPSVDSLLHSHTAAELVARYGRPLTLDAIRYALTEIRRDFKVGKHTLPDPGRMMGRAAKILESWAAPTLEPVINATGVILHTNLGRAPLSRAALHAMQAVAGGYANLEYDLETGKRGSRSVHAENFLTRLTGAEAALVVNNNAAAVLLALSALARRRKVVIARTQLVEIGGGFRIPEVMQQSGAKLLEVGATNRVHLSDYEDALKEDGIALVMRAHRSNFEIVGFTGEPSLREIAEVSRRAGLPLLDDLGSGSLLDTARFGLAHEPTVQESLKDGADLVCFSGDKLLGGPQAGIIVGKAELIEKLKKHPMARAVRADKLALAALSATLLHYLKDEAEREIPIWRMITTDLDIIQERARVWAHELGQGEVVAGQSAVGGGSLPGETLPTFLLSLTLPHPDQFLNRLRRASPPIIARLDEDRILLDPRTVLEDHEGALLVGLQNALSEQENTDT